MTRFLRFFGLLTALTYTGFGANEDVISAQVFDPNVPAADCNYHSITTASNGRLYFTLSTHHIGHAAVLLEFDPESEEIQRLGNMSEALGERLGETIPHGKVHTPLFEYQESLYFATHLSYYKDGLPNPDPQGRRPYSGGRFLSYDLNTETFTGFKGTYENEGIIALVMDVQRGVLYGLTWPGAHLVTLQVGTGEFRDRGPTQGLGEWGRGLENQKVCRSLGIDSEGNVYGSDDTGRVWVLELGQSAEVIQMREVSLRKLIPDAGIDPEGWYNWRVIAWDQAERAFRGLLWQTGAAFLFRPGDRAVLYKTGDAQPARTTEGRLQGRTAQLGYLLQADGDAYYLAHGDPIQMEGRSRTSSQVYLMHLLHNGQTVDYGPVFTTDGRRVFFAESLERGPDGHLYTVAWVEVLDLVRQKEILEFRSVASPGETEGMTYEMLLLRIADPSR